MEIIKANYLGFCGGVKRAISLAENELNNGCVFCYGNLIHNEQELTRIKDLGLKIVDSYKKVPPKSKILIRAHGCSLKDKKKLAKRFNIIAGTCPNVLRNQKLAQEYSKKGYTVLIFGKKEHAEIQALQSYAKKGVIIEHETDFPSKIKGNVVAISQTTIDHDLYNELIKKAKALYPNCEIIDTICNATRLRNDSVIELSKLVDALIVVGDNSSSNSKALFKTAQKTDLPCFFVSKSEDLENLNLTQYEKIGLSASASSPDWLITAIENKLKSM